MMTTYNEKHHWVFPLSPTSCAYAKLNDYFSENAKGANRGFAGTGGFWGPFGSSESNKKKKPKVTRVSWKCKSIISEMKNAIRNTCARMVNVLSGSEIDKITADKLRGVENYII